MATATVRTMRAAPRNAPPLPLGYRTVVRGDLDSGVGKPGHHRRGPSLEARPPAVRPKLPLRGRQRVAIPERLPEAAWMPTTPGRAFIALIMTASFWQILIHQSEQRHSAPMLVDVIPAISLSCVPAQSLPTCKRASPVRLPAVDLPAGASTLWTPDAAWQLHGAQCGYGGASQVYVLGVWRSFVLAVLFTGDATTLKPRTRDAIGAL